MSLIYYYKVEDKTFHTLSHFQAIFNFFCNRKKEKKRTKNLHTLTYDLN